MWDSLKSLDEDYGFVIDVLKIAIEKNAVINEDQKSHSLHIHGLIFSDKYQDIITICDEQLDIFSKFGFTVTVSNSLTIHNDVKYIC